MAGGFGGAGGGGGLLGGGGGGGGGPILGSFAEDRLKRREGEKKRGGEGLRWLG